MLVLSQLDTRYFRGLQGQYNFRLQFRLHEEGRPGAEEYIVRSHGNYLMDRSVSVELPSVGPGSYVVFISIIGERDTRVLSTEDVIKRECRGREENEKLAQVGQAYDLAHSKATSHLQRLSKVRKQAESKKASESRRKERRKNWEKRQTGREIARKQKDKDSAKKAQQKAVKRAKAADAAAAREKAAAEAAHRAAVEKKAAEEERARKAELQPPHSGAQAETKDVKDADNVSTTSTSSSSTGTPQYTPQETPKSVSAHPVEGNKTVNVPPAEHSHAHKDVSGGPPQPQSLVHTLCTAQAEAHKSLELKLHYCSCSTCKPPPKVEESDGYSSDSPVEDYELLYDEDDVTPTLRMAGAAPAPPAPNAADSDDEDGPDPWNAIAVIGFRVYSKDEGLELRVVMEGGELEQDGMGNLGEADLDNAVSNAAGQREKKKKQLEEDRASSGGRAADAVPCEQQVPEVNVIPDTDTETKNRSQDAQSNSNNKIPVSGMAAYRTIIERQTSEYDRVMGKTKVVEPEHYAESLAPAGQAANRDETSASPDQPVDEKPVAEPTPVVVERAGSVDNKVQSWQSSQPPRTTTVPTTKEKAIWHLRHKLQSSLVTRARRVQALTPAEMRDASALLAELEAHADLAAPVLRATKIHKVLRAVVKMERLPRDDDDEFALWLRVRALLDDYELTLATADDGDEDEDRAAGSGIAVRSSAGDGEQDGYFAQNPGKH